MVHVESLMRLRLLLHIIWLIIPQALNISKRMGCG